MNYESSDEFFYLKSELIKSFDKLKSSYKRSTEELSFLESMFLESTYSIKEMKKEDSLFVKSFDDTQIQIKNHYSGFDWDFNTELYHTNSGLIMINKLVYLDKHCIDDSFRERQIDRYLSNLDQIFENLTESSDIPKKQVKLAIKYLNMMYQ